MILKGEVPRTRICSRVDAFNSIGLGGGVTGVNGVCAEVVIAGQHIVSDFFVCKKASAGSNAADAASRSCDRAVGDLLINIINVDGAVIIGYVKSEEAGTVAGSGDGRVAIFESALNATGEAIIFGGGIEQGVCDADRALAGCDSGSAAACQVFAICDAIAKACCAVRDFDSDIKLGG